MPADPEIERKRLTALYAHMIEGELRKVAHDAADLTDIARQVLTEEVERRGLDLASADPVPVDEIQSQEMVTVRQFRDLPEALMAKGRLDSAGIECFVDQNMVRMDWFISNLLGGIKLEVKKDDLEESLALLSEPFQKTSKLREREPINSLNVCGADHSRLRIMQE